MSEVQGKVAPNRAFGLKCTTDEAILGDQFADLLKKRPSGLSRRVR